MHRVKDKSDLKSSKKAVSTQSPHSGAKSKPKEPHLPPKRGHSGAITKKSPNLHDEPKYQQDQGSNNLNTEMDEIHSDIIDEDVLKKKTLIKEALPFTITNNEMITIDLKELPAALKAVYSHGGYTPLILDDSGRVDIFFSYSGEDALVVDVKPIIGRVHLEKSWTVDDAKEHIRKLCEFSD